MHNAAILLIGLLSGVGASDYSRSLTAKELDQATLDAEGYGEKNSLKRQDDGLRITLGPGLKETGWKTPQQLRFGGNFTISANLVIKKIPKPAQEDGAAIGLALAFQDINQPDVTLLRLREPSGLEVYRTVEKAMGNPMQMQMQMGFGQPGQKPPKPPRRTSPAAGDAVRLEIQREGNTIRYQVLEGNSGRTRYLGQVEVQPMDVSAIKLFASNRNGVEPLDVILRDITIHADRINGLGTMVRTVFDQVIYGEPTAIVDGILLVGDQVKTGPGANPNQPEAPVPTPPGLDPDDSPEPGLARVPGAVVLAMPAGQGAVIAGGPVAAAPAVVAAAPVAAPAPAAATPAPAVAAPPSDPFAPDAAPSAVFAPAPAPAPPPPKAKIPLDELESIRFERTPVMSARFMGQPNLDFTLPGLSAKKDDATKKPDAKKTDGTDDVLAPPPGTTAPTKIAKVDPKKNGIRDLNLSLFNLRSAEIKQVTVTCQTDKAPTSWRLDTTDSQDWPLVVRRSGTEPMADLYLEPPPGDCFQKDFTIAVIYADGQNANANAKADAHTKPDLAVDPKAPGIEKLDAWLYLTGEEKLCGKLESISQEAVRITTPWQDHLDVPLARVIGIHLGLIERKESAAAFARRLKARGSEDQLLAQIKTGEVVAIPGLIEGTEEDKLRFQYKGRTRTLPLKQVEGLVMASRAESDRTDVLRTTFSLPADLLVSGRWKGLDASVWKVETAWGQELKLPAADVQSVRFHGGKLTYLSDLNPSKVEEIPFFGRRLSWRRDVNLMGEPLKMNGQTYDRGVAVHSRSILTYDLNGRYSTFEALVGFDDASKGQGRVDCRVFADGREIFANPDLKASDPPVKLSLPVSGAEQLRLQVDFGRGQNTGDRVIWANARLYRQSSPKAATTPTR